MIRYDEQKKLLRRTIDELETLLPNGFVAESAGQILVNSGSALKPTAVGAFDRDARHEDLDAVFTDVDNDGDLDLYVASGSNEWPANATNYRDRLYINDGSGGFSASYAGNVREPG